MKKLIICATAAIVATLSLVTTADADHRWRRHDNHRSWDHEYRNSDRDSRRHNHRRWSDRRWRGNYGVVIVPRYAYQDQEEYCFIKKVRRYDDWGNTYIKRIRVCR